MNNPKKIEDLLDKFRKGILSPMETRELLAFLRTGDEDSEMLKAMNEYWEQAHEVNVPTRQMLERLQQEISRMPEEIVIPVRKTFLRLSSFLRYAAVIVFTVGLTWLVKDIYSSGEDRISSTYLTSMNEVSVPFGSKSKVVLPDGSVVNLNSGSTLQYPAVFSKKERTVFINGEGYFDVKRNEKVPFFVKTSDITIKVLGTSFNVKSYDDEKTVETTLVNGMVEIYANKNVSERNRLLVLNPNQQATFEKQTGEITLAEAAESLGAVKEVSVEKQERIHKIEMDPVIAWKDNRLVFRDEEFLSLSRKFERWYNVEIEIQDEELAHTLFSGIFEKETVEQALEAMKVAMPFNYTISKNIITITR